MRLYNTLSSKKELFKPRDGNQVKMYVCGITPYDTTHLGHAFTYMAFDVLQRYLHYQGYEVMYVQNVTDIDDDILKKAKQLNKDWQELGTFWTNKFLADIRTLHITMPTHYVKATETIETIIEIVKTLESQGIAYEKDGNVYFAVQKDTEYGKLSKLTRDEMITLSKERGADPNDPRKNDPLDFIMWQKSLPDEPYWQSPWGNGRPGWHIECSAMIYKYIYKYIDIHGGGTDLVYPHHESEIAQSEMFTKHKPFSNFWLHTGAVGYQGEKMSKSLGNLVMVSDLLKTYAPNAIRYLLLSYHYRKPWEFTESLLQEAAKKIQIIEAHIKTVTPALNEKSHHLQRFDSAMNNDLDTPQALHMLDETIMQKDYQTAKKITAILGFLF